MAELDPERFAAESLGCARGMDGLDGPEIGERLDTLLACVRLVHEGHPGDIHLMMAHVRIARRCGELHEALRVAQAVHSREPCLETAVMVAGGHRELGRVDATVAAYRAALAFEPENVAVRLDIGDVLLVAGRFEEALGAYEGVLRRSPGHPLALPSVYCLRYWLHGRPEWRTRLEAFAHESTPPNERAEALLAEVTPYVGYLPDPGDSLVSSARALELQLVGPLTSGTTSRVSVLEAPSAVFAYRMTTGTPHTLHVELVPSPDPRQPRRPVPWQLWAYDGTEPRRALEPPAEAVAAAVGELALVPYHVDHWRALGADLAARLGVEAMGDLLASMVWPPPAPAGTPAWRWMVHVQFAVAFVLAALDEGWVDSARRLALFSLADGPTDWVGGAAVVALGEIARDEPAHAPEIAEHLLEMLQEQPSAGGWCLERPLVYALLRIPGLPEELEAELRAYRDRL